ncbi:MAG: hypothetical protein HYX21_03200 [Candidatus Yanofskybacteria bacterium]|nr:hypothetical protein [Candidatus Yanofskybacteria bacterium]
MATVRAFLLSLAVILYLSFLAIFAVASNGNLFITQTNGPSAGAIKHGLGFSPAKPDIVYVDRYKSMDGGNTWREFSLSADEAVRAIAVDPKNADILYLAANHTIYKSSDGALSWQKLIAIDPRGDNPTISALVINPDNSNIVYAGTTHGDLYKTADGGLNWQSVSGRLGTNAPISRIVFNLQNTQEIYVGAGSWYLSALVGLPKRGGGLLVSRDGGENFEKIESDFKNDLVQDVDVLGKTIYASVHHAPDSNEEWRRIYKSEDGGVSWKIVLDKRILTHTAVNPKNANHIVVSGADNEPFYVSKDGGASWKTVGLGSSEPIRYTHELEIVDDNNVYALEYYKPFMKSSDGGSSWRWSSDGIKNSSVYALRIHPANRNKVLAGTGDGALHTTLDGGKIWKRFFGSNLEGGSIAAIEFNPANSDTLYFGVTGATDRATGRYFGAPWRDTGLYASNDSGLSWSKTRGLAHPYGNNDNQLEVYDIFIHPQNPNLMLVGTASEGIYRSEDGGKTWQDANSGISKEGFYWNLNLKPEGNTPRERCEGEFGKYKAGQKFDTGCFYYATHTSMKLAVRPSNSHEIWYTTLNGVFVSRDSGRSWQWLSDDLKNIHVHFMAFDPQDPDIIYLGTHQGAIDSHGNVADSSKGLLISRNGGKNWSQVANGPGQGHDIRAIAVNPEDPNMVVVGTEDPLYVSRDKGKTWTKLVTPKLKEADRIQIDSSAKIIYMGTAQAGVWRGIVDYSSAASALIEVTGVTAPMSAKAGDKFLVEISVDNIGGKAGSMPVNLKIGGFNGLKTADLSLADQETVNFSASVKEKGEYDIFVNGQSYGKITIGSGSVFSGLLKNDDGENKGNERAAIREEKTGENKNILGKFFWPVFWIIFAVTTILLGIKIAPKIFHAIFKRS